MSIVGGKGAQVFFAPAVITIATKTAQIWYIVFMLVEFVGDKSILRIEC